MLNKPRLLTPGPTQLPERVRLVMAQDMIHHRKPVFKNIMLDLQVKLQRLFGTVQPVLPLAASGSGAMTAAVQNLCAPGEKVLVLEAGKFAERWTRICEVSGVPAEPVKIDWGLAADPAELRKRLAADPKIRAVFVQLCETSTGVQHPVRELAAVTRESNALLIVDGISGVGICPCPMDAWGVDCLLTGSQKGLMLPPGLALIALSERAWTKAEQTPPQNFYFNLLKEKANVIKGQTLFTPAISLLIGLNESMDMFFEAGLENIYRKQYALASMARAGISAAGFELFARECPAWGVTSLAPPPGVSAGAMLKIAEERYGVIMAAGQEPLKDSMIRVGHMGWVDWADLAAGLHALVGSFTACGGHVGCRDYLEQALTAYHQALDGGCPE